MKKTAEKPTAPKPSNAPRKNGSIVEATGKRIGKSKVTKADNQRNRRVK